MRLIMLCPRSSPAQKYLIHYFKSFRNQSSPMEQKSRMAKQRASMASTAQTLAPNFNKFNRNTACSTQSENQAVPGTGCPIFDQTLRKISPAKQKTSATANLLTKVRQPKERHRTARPVHWSNELTGSAASVASAHCSLVRCLQSLAQEALPTPRIRLNCAL